MRAPKIRARRRCSLCRLPVILLLLAGGCATHKAPFAFDRAPLFAMVHDSDGVPVGGAEISADGSRVAVSDSGGRAVIPELARGSHTVVVTREGYEEIRTTFAFENQNQLLYLRLTSFQHLLARLEKTIKEGEWRLATDLLRRVEGVRRDDARAVFLRAVIASKRNKPATARDELLSLVEKGMRAPAVFLFLADLYQYRLGRVDLAAKALRQALSERESAAVRKRLGALVGAPK